MDRFTDRLTSVRTGIFDALLSIVEGLSPEIIQDIAPRTDKWVLPPYPGEMGHEVRGFIGRVEPYLRHGWKILSRRPSLYPAGTAIHDEEYFESEAQLFKQYKVRRWSHAVLLPSRNPFIHIQFRRRWRRLFGPYLLVKGRPITEWDSVLFSTRAFYNPLIDFVSIVPPSYSLDLDGPGLRIGPHIGVQMRRMDTARDRNSDAEFMLSAAKSLSDRWVLPILVYGHADGSYLPGGYRCTAHEADCDLLKFELGCLRSCRLMLSPDSGWADIMAWLKIPTLVERELFPNTFYRWQRYGARIRIFDPAESLVEQSLRLLDAPSDRLDGSPQPSSRDSETALSTAKSRWVSWGA